ncbi:hypothetical protein AC1031_006330 [Aphanomyces cochlioides]|nr:hypothetical protein AC1031_006330 [Aphanomyces cochlioides]
MIMLAAALAICSIVEVVSQLSLNCAYSDLQQPYISIVEFNRSNNLFQLVDHHCQILNTSSVQPSTNYQAVGNVQDYVESSLPYIRQHSHLDARESHLPADLDKLALVQPQSLSAKLAAKSQVHLHGRHGS